MAFELHNIPFDQILKELEQRKLSLHEKDQLSKFTSSFYQDVLSYRKETQRYAQSLNYEMRRFMSVDHLEEYGKKLRRDAFFSDAEIDGFLVLYKERHFKDSGSV